MTRPDFALHALLAGKGPLLRAAHVQVYVRRCLYTIYANIQIYLRVRAGICA